MRANRSSSCRPVAVETSRATDCFWACRKRWRPDRSRCGSSPGNGPVVRATSGRADDSILMTSAPSMASKRPQYPAASPVAGSSTVTPARACRPSSTAPPSLRVPPGTRRPATLPRLHWTSDGIGNVALGMAIAITEDHHALARTAAELLQKREARRASRELLEAETEPMPAMWDDIVNLGWLGLHLPEAYGGSGYGIEELVVVVEELAKAVAPGPFVPTAIASAVLAAAGDEATKERLLPGLADGSTTGAVALGGSVTISDGTASGDAGIVLGGGLAKVLLIPAGDDV